MNKKIAFEDSISSAMKQVCPAIKINKDGVKLLNDVMNKINSSLQENFGKEYGSEKKIFIGTGLKCAQKAVSKVFPAEFRQLAVAEGQRKVTLFKQGEIEYDFQRSIKEAKASRKLAKKPKTEKVQPMLWMFTSAVAKVNKRFSSRDARLDPKAKELLGIYLYKLTAGISARAAENASENSIVEYNQIEQVLPEFLPSSVLEFAHNEGSRNMCLHEQEIEVFKPRRIRSVFSDIINDPLLKVVRGASEQSTLIPLDPSVLKTGIRKLQPDNTVKMDPSVAQNVSQVANHFCTVLKRRTEQQNLQEIDHSTMTLAVTEFFPPNLLDHGAHHVYHLVTDYAKKAFTYKKRKTESITEQAPRKRRKISKESPATKTVKRTTRKKSVGKKRPKTKSTGKKQPKSKTKKPEAVKKAKKEKEVNFSKNILDVFEKAFSLKSPSSVTIGRSGVQKLNAHIVDAMKLLVNECSRESTITTASVRAAVENNFCEDLSRHAIVAASRALQLFSKDGYQCGTRADPKERMKYPEVPQNLESTDEGTDSDDQHESREEAPEEPGSIETSGSAEAIEAEGSEDEDAPNDNSSAVKAEVPSVETTETVPMAADQDTE